MIVFALCVRATVFFPCVLAFVCVHIRASVRACARTGVCASLCARVRVRVCVSE